MQTKKTLWVLGLMIIVLAGCGKNEDDAAQPGAAAAAPFFTPGKGFRYLNTISANEGSTKPMSFSSCDLSVTADGNIHWCVDRSYTFADSRKAGRFTLDPNTGDTLPVTGKRPDEMVPGYEWGKNAYDVDHLDRLLYKPYSDELYLSYRSANHVFSIAGDVPAFDYEDWSFNRHPRMFANGDITMPFFEQAAASISQTYSRIKLFLWHNGTKVPNTAGKSRVLWTYMNQNMDSLWHGGTGFPAGNNGQTLACTFDGHAVYLIDTGGHIIHTQPFKGQPFMENSASNAANIAWTVKTSQDMQTTTLLCRDEDRVSGGFYYSTFVVNNATRKIAVAVNAARVDNVMEMDFDLQGNIYSVSYPESDAATTKIVSIAPGGARKVMAEDFIGRQAVKGLYARNGRIYLAVISNAKDEYGSTVAKITLLVSE